MEKKTALGEPRKDAETATTPVPHSELGAGDDKIASKDADAALQYALGESVTLDEATNARIRRKIDWHVLPWMFFLFTIQYFDKTSLSYAAIMGIREDTNLTTAQYAW